MTELQITAQHWSKQPDWNAGLYWLELPAVTQRLNTEVSGDPTVDWIAYTLQHYFPDTLPLGHCLSLGCGKGALERRLADLGAFESCDAFDIAPGCIAEAQARAAQAGYSHIHYDIADINTLTLEPTRYDLVLGNASIHHITALEAVFEQIARALKPDGLFVLNEYIGPSRFQFPPQQQAAIQACWDLLPPAYRQPLAAGCLNINEQQRSDAHCIGIYNVSQKNCAMATFGQSCGGGWRCGVEPQSHTCVFPRRAMLLLLILLRLCVLPRSSPCWNATLRSSSSNRWGARSCNCC